MKKTLITLLAALFCTSIGVASEDDTLYINQYRREKKVTPFKVSQVEEMKITRGASYRYDSLVVKTLTDEEWKFNLTAIDSITLYEPRDLLLKELDNFSAKNIPTYTDDYSSYSGWGNRSRWNLANVHDPTVFKAEDGYYYMYQTDASYGNAHTQAGGHFMARRSADLVNWTILGPAMKGDAPAWVKDSCNAVRTRMGLPLLGSTEQNKPAFGYWAPVARKIKDGLYRLYYCIILDNYIKTGNITAGNDFDGSWSERAYIGMMETSDPASNVWVDKGYVICSSSDKIKGGYARSSTNDWNGYFKWNAIDPSLEITPEGDHWLIYGSWHSGLCAIQLDPETGKLPKWPGEPWTIGAGTNTRYGKRVATRLASSRWQGSEGPEVIYNPETGYYYLFMAYDELSVAYNTRVARSKNIDGPYVGMDGVNISTNGGDCYPVVTHPYKFNPANASQSVSGWVGFSHCCVFQDGKGNWFYSSQARLPENYNNNAYSNAIMMGHVRSIRWTENGWPVVMPERYAATPQPSISAEELVGTWENIDLSYSYGKQKTSTTLQLNADGTLSGTYTGTWEYNPDGQTLKFNCRTGHSGVLNLCIQREVDWEASPRKVTIVYGGYSANGRKTVWGKKVE